MRILLIEPEKEPMIREIDGSLKSMQEAVGGYIQAIYPYEDPVALVCGDEAKLQGLSLNRALYEQGSCVPYDIIAGTFFVCGVGNENFTSLTEEQIQAYTERFAMPELFLSLNGHIIAVPVKCID